MVTPFQTVTRQPRLAIYSSVAAHGLLLLWILYPASPKLVAPSFVVNGDHGTAVAHLYWPSQEIQITTDASPGTSAADTRQQLNAHLTWRRRTRVAKVAERELVSHAADLAVGVASERIKQTITEDDQKRLADRYVQQLKR